MDFKDGRYCEDITDEDDFLNSFETSPIKILAIDYPFLPWQGYGHLVTKDLIHRALAGNPSVERIQFSGGYNYNLGDRCFEAVDGHSLLQLLPDLQEIFFSGSVSSSQGVGQSLIDWTKKSNGCRKTLSFSMGDVEEIVEICSQEQSKLVDLRFSYCDIDNTGAFAIARLLQRNNTNLQYISIFGTSRNSQQPRSDGYNAVLQGMRRNTKLISFWAGNLKLPEIEHVHSICHANKCLLHHAPARDPIQLLPEIYQHLAAHPAALLQCVARQADLGQLLSFVEPAQKQATAETAKLKDAAM